MIREIVAVLVMFYGLFMALFPEQSYEFNRKFSNKRPKATDYELGNQRIAGIILSIAAIIAFIVIKFF